MQSKERTTLFDCTETGTIINFPVGPSVQIFRLSSAASVSLSNLSFRVLLFLCQDRSRYQRRNRLDRHDQDPKISLLLLGLGFRQGPNSLLHFTRTKNHQAKVQ